MQKKKQKEGKYMNNKYCRPTGAPPPEWATWLIQAHAKQQHNIKWINFDPNIEK